MIKRGVSGQLLLMADYYYSPGFIEGKEVQVSIPMLYATSCVEAEAEEYLYEPVAALPEEFSGGDSSALMAVLQEQQQQPNDSFVTVVNAPTMHPNLVSTLKSLIDDGVNNAKNGSGGSSRWDSKRRREDEMEEDDDIATVPVDLIQNRRPFKCTYGGCGKNFKNPQTLKMHHKTHYSHSREGAGEWRPGGAARPEALHKGRAGHNKKIPSRCPVCRRTFVGLYELRRHFGRKHSEGEKMHACRKCGKRFYIEVDLRDHEKLCGEPIGCKCGMKFAFKCNLVAHKKTHPECQDINYCHSLDDTKSSSSNNCSAHNSSTTSSSLSSSAPAVALMPPTVEGFPEMAVKLEDIDFCFINRGLAT